MLPVSMTSLPTPKGLPTTPVALLESPETSLRVAGIASAVLGLLLIWFVRG